MVSVSSCEGYIAIPSGPVTSESKQVVVHLVTGPSAFELTPGKAGFNFRGSLSAQMAELVDALHSGCSGSNPVEVQVLFWAPFVKVFEPAFLKKSKDDPAQPRRGERWASTAARSRLK